MLSSAVSLLPDVQSSSLRDWRRCARELTLRTEDGPNPINLERPEKNRQVLVTHSQMRILLADSQALRQSTLPFHSYEKGRDAAEYQLLFKYHKATTKSYVLAMLRPILTHQHLNPQNPPSKKDYLKVHTFPPLTYLILSNPHMIPPS